MKTTFSPRNGLLKALTCVAVTLLVGATAAFGQQQTPALTAPAKGQPQLLSPTEWKAGMQPQTINYDGLPLGEVAKNLVKIYSNQFDVLMPQTLVRKISKPAPDLPSEGIDPASIGVSLRLQNVTAAEVFQAMNMQFEIDQTPARWELVSSGKRPLAVLRPAEVAEQEVGSLAPPVKKPSRVAIYIGDLLEKPNRSGFKVEQLIETLEEIFSGSIEKPGITKLSYHKGAELLIVSGSDSDLQFAHQVIEELRNKVLADRMGTQEVDPATGLPKAR